MKTRLIILCVVILPYVAFGQSAVQSAAVSDSSSSSVASPSFSSDVSRGLGSIGHVMTSPFRWSLRDAAYAGVFVVASAGCFLLDDEVRSIALKNNSVLNDNLEKIGFNYGAPQYAGPGAVVVYLAGVVSGNEDIRQTGLMLTQMIVVTGLIQIPSKIIAGRARPETNEGNASFEAFNGIGQDHSSFFSGHSMIAFGFSTILARKIDHPAATVGLYALATLTPWARAYKDRHWFSDCFIGSTLGILAGNSLFDWNESHPAFSNNFHILPTGNGLAVSVTF